MEQDYKYIRQPYYCPLRVFLSTMLIHAFFSPLVIYQQNYRSVWSQCLRFRIKAIKDKEGLHVDHNAVQCLCWTCA
jgi:hypothetical protein